MKKLLCAVLCILIVAAFAGCTLCLLERTEAEERNRVALLQSFLDNFVGSRNYGLRLFLGNLCLRGGRFDEICFLQEYTLFL